MRSDGERSAKLLAAEDGAGGVVVGRPALQRRRFHLGRRPQPPGHQPHEVHAPWRPLLLLPLRQRRLRPPHRRRRRGRQAVVPLVRPRRLQRRRRRRRGRGGGRPVAGRDEAPRRAPADQGGSRRHEGFRAPETAAAVCGTRA